MQPKKSVLQDPVWSSVRRRLTPVFTKLKLQALYPILIRKSNDLKKRIKEDTKKNIKINLRVSIHVIRC